MLRAMKYFWKEQPIALVAFVLAFALLVFFSWRFVGKFLYFNDPAHHNQALEPWMTPKYVGMSYKLPREVIDNVMQLHDKQGKRIKLEEVVDNMGITLSELQSRILQAQQQFEAQKALNGDRPPKPLREDWKKENPEKDKGKNRSQDD